MRCILNYLNIYKYIVCIFICKYKSSVERFFLYTTLLVYINASLEKVFLAYQVLASVLAHVLRDHLLYI